MPLYDFHCRDCDQRFEALSPPGAAPTCPMCGGHEVERVFTPFAGPFTLGLRGKAARRSDSLRTEREQQRQQRRAQRRAKPEGGGPTG